MAAAGLSGVLYFAAKAPRPGAVKTRLAPALGPPGAARVYRGFLRDIAERFTGSGLEAGWFVPPGDWPEVARAIAAGPATRVRIQRGITWAERQQNLFRDASAAGEMPLVLAATDSPQLRVGDVAAAFDALEAADVVLGPTHDGGYYLVGMRQNHEILAGAAMSTADALSEVVRRARKLGLAVTTLPPTFDVDHPQDLDRLLAEVRERFDLRHTREALGA